jgi:hypothetical protein
MMSDEAIRVSLGPADEPIQAGIFRLGCQRVRQIVRATWEQQQLLPKFGWGLKSLRSLEELRGPMGPLMKIPMPSPAVPGVTAP